MSSDNERAASAETYQEKALRKFKQQPLVPIGALATTFALIMAGSKLRNRESKSMNYWLRARVIAQGLTIVAVVAGSWKIGQKKAQLDQVSTAAVEQDELSGREKRKAEFQERLRGAEESHRLEVAAAAGMGPVEQGQKAIVEQEVKKPEKKPGFDWSVLSKAHWFGLETTKAHPPPVEQGEMVIAEQEVKKPEKKTGFDWSVLSKAHWFGLETTKAHPPPIEQGGAAIAEQGVKKPEKAGFDWSVLSKAHWFGLETTKAHPPPAPSSTATPTSTTAEDNRS